MPEYDLFVSYNRRDVDAVRQVVRALEDRRFDGRPLRVWIDEFEIKPGDWWQDLIEKGLKSSGSIAIFVGPGGFGQWEKPEMRVAIDRRVKESIPVFPVLLPGALDRLEGRARIEDVLPSFLAQLSAVDFATGLDDKTAINRLYWAVTGQNPLADVPDVQPQRPVPSDTEQDAGATAVNDAAEAIVDGDAVFLLGRMAAGAQNQYAPAPSELSARLLRELDLVRDDYSGLVPGMESVASLVAATKGDRGLELRMRNMLARSGDPQPGAHSALAGLMKLLARRPSERRARRRAPRLILTTSYDLLMERALLRAGTSFSRLVQFRGEPRIDVTVFDNVARTEGGDILIGNRAISPTSGAQLDDAIYSFKAKEYRYNPQKRGAAANPLASLAIDELPDPILYKYQGSQDIENSCAISADHCFEFTWRLLKQECVPSQITEIVGNSTLIILGSSVLDPDFRLIYHTLLRKPLEINTSYPRYAIVSRQDVDLRDCNLQITQREWRAIEQTALEKFRIKSVDAPVADYLTQLAKRLAEIWGI